MIRWKGVDSFCRPDVDNLTPSKFDGCWRRHLGKKMKLKCYAGQKKAVRCLTRQVSTDLSNAEKCFLILADSQD